MQDFDHWDAKIDAESEEWRLYHNSEAITLLDASSSGRSSLIYNMILGWPVFMPRSQPSLEDSPAADSSDPAGSESDGAVASENCLV